MTATSGNPFISIVMPVYNGGDYFEMALASACAQQYDRFEVIVVDDGSTDDGRAERAAAAAGSRVRYYRQENQGVAGALNTGLERMRGDVFCWLSHDDLFESRKTARQVDFYSHLRFRDAVLISDYDLIDPDGAFVQTIRVDRDRLMKAPIAALLMGAVNGCTIFAPAHVMHETGRFDTSFRYTQDYRFWNRMIQKFDFFHQPERLVRYRVHPGQGSNHEKAVVEGDALWIDMMSERSETERVHIAGSSLLFFRQMAAHLAGSPYLKAKEYAHSRAIEEQIDSSFGLALAVEAGQSTAAIRFLDEARSRFGVAAHISAACASLEEVDRLRAAGLDTVGIEGAGIADLFNAAMEHTRGAYVAFARAGSSPLENWPLRIQAMRQDGLLAMASTPTDGSLSRAEVLLGRGSFRPRLDDLTIHRMMIDEGRRFEETAFALDEALALLPFVDDTLALRQTRG